jgi:hypothetical protein
MDHVHIELNKLGATMKTTFWNKKVSYPVETQAPPVQPQQPQPQTTLDTSGGSTDGTDHHHDWNGGGGGAAYP